jgi:hypothetical protein
MDVLALLLLLLALVLFIVAGVIRPTPRLELIAFGLAAWVGSVIITLPMLHR